jgi:eukaryotic-like serine/threonine-protein kinase
VLDVFPQLQEGLADRYRLERELGRGGMATVYLAHDLRHDRKVALKVLQPELAATLGPERFQREIRTTARLQHPHILTVLDSGEAAGQLWYTMPFVRGESLRDRLQREGQLPVDMAVDLACQVALALDYAHHEGVVHRDLKPENILLSDGQALVADFGIAKALSAAGEAQLTGTGMAVGTPAYMSPEQAGGGQVDGRSDLYALGCVVYEMLAGEPPFSGSTPQAVIAKRVLEPVPHVRTLRESVSVPIEQALLRALAKTPADRFATVGEFARALSTPLAAPAVPSGTTAPPGLSELALRRRSRMSTGLAAIVLVGLGMLFVWRKSHRPDEASGPGPTRLAVLPFENLGRPEDEYFADGVTDEVRGKLAALAGLEVIARTSSGQYKQTTKRPQQIGRELGVDYLLTGTVRWEKNSGGPSRVRVSPELVQVSTASTKWQTAVEAPLTDVFRVQADVAGRVAEALGLALRTGERERLGERPTQNLAAYDAFLRGEAAADGLATLDPVALQRAGDYYERAVALDSSFSLAWAQLSRAHSILYYYDLSSTTPAMAKQARLAAERAVVLAPDHPEGYLALGYYYGWVRLEHAGALEQYAHGRQLAPKDARLLSAQGWSELSLGRAEEALSHLREAEVLDPRSVLTARFVVDALLGLRRYSEALAAAERCLALAPSNLLAIHAKALVHLGLGDLAGAQAVLRAASREVDPTALVAYMALRGDLYWVLEDEQQRLLLRLSPEPFGRNRADWGLALAETYALRGDSARARIYADSARLALENRLRDAPDLGVLHALRGVVLAYLGRRTEAIPEGERAVGLVPLSSDVLYRAYVQHQLVRIYLLLGEPERALDQLEPLLKLPYWLSPGWLKIDPNFDPLRGNPRFERLVNWP